MPVAREALRAARERRGQTREDTAEALRVSVITIGRWERGENELSVAYRRPLARHLDVTLDGLEEWLHPSCQACETSRAPGVRLPEPTFDVSEDEDMRRREVLRAALAGSGVVLAAPMLTAASRLPGTLADGDLDDLEAAIDGYGRAYPIEPPAALLPAVVADFGDVARRRAARDSDTLASASARLASLTAGILGNLGRSGEAQPWLAVAKRDAQKARHPDAHGWSYTREAMWPLFHGNPRKALEIARAGQQTAGTTPAGGQLTLLEAIAHADLGDPASAIAAVDRAEHTSSRGSGMSTFTLTDAQRAYWASMVYTRIGAIDEADWARRTVYDTVDARDRAYFDLDRGICLAHVGEPEAAAELGDETLHALAAGQRTSNLLARASDLASMLSGCDSRPVREFVDTFALSTAP